jgi:hypothetical protein
MWDTRPRLSIERSSIRPPVPQILSFLPKAHLSKEARWRACPEQAKRTEGTLLFVGDHHVSCGADTPSGKPRAGSARSLDSAVAFDSTFLSSQSWGTLLGDTAKAGHPPVTACGVSGGFIRLT